MLSKRPDRIPAMIPLKFRPRRSKPCAVLTFLLLCAIHPAGQDAPKLVVAEQVRRSLIQDEAILTGSVISPMFASLSAETDGLITSIEVTEGETIQAGRLLAKLDSTFAELDVKTSAILLDKAKAEYEEALRKYEEAVRLSSDSVIAESQVKSLKAQCVIKEAEFAGARLGLQRAEESLKRHQIRAPFSGILFEKNTEVGQWIRMGDPTLTLVAVDPLWVEFQLPQIHWSRINKSTPVKLHFDSLPEETFTARIQSIIAVGNRQSRAFPIRVSLPNPEGKLAPGMSARIEVVFENTNKNLMAVPRDAVIQKADGSKLVWRLKREDSGSPVVESVAVRLGRNRDNLVEILGSELTDQDWVVTRGNESLEPGQIVRVANDSPSI